MHQELAGGSDVLRGGGHVVTVMDPRIVKLMCVGREPALRCGQETTGPEGRVLLSGSAHTVIDPFEG